MERLTYEKRPSSWNLGKYPTNYTSRHTFQEVVARLAAYEDTGLGPEEITTEPYGCVFYCNRKCSLDGDFCAEGPGCPWEIDAETAKHMQELAQAEKDGRLVVLDEDVILAMSAGARAILNNKRLQGVTYVYDCFGEFGGPKEISYLKAAEILYRIGSTDLAFQEAEAALKKREEAHEREGV